MVRSDVTECHILSITAGEYDEYEAFNEAIDAIDSVARYVYLVGA